MQSVNPQEKKININGLNINYKQIGNGNVAVVLLHGWGVSSDKYLELARWLHSPEGLWSHNAESDMQRLETKDNLQEDSLREYGANEGAKKLHSLEARTMEPANSSKFKILIPDLPGFGKSEEPKEDWKLDDYVEFADKFIEKASRKSGFELVKNLLKKFNPKNLTSQLSIEQTPQPPLSGGLSSFAGSIVPPYRGTGQAPGCGAEAQKIILIGHSFGGRVAIKYAAKYPEKIDKLILTGAAGIKHKLNTKQKIFFILAKMGKKIFSLLEEIKLPTKANKRLFAFVGSWASLGREFLYKLAREKDYYKASPRMKEIMKNVLAEDLTPYLGKIKTPTLLAWGAKDNSTPLSDGKIMNEKIENSELVIFDGANHSLPYQKPEEFARVVAEFIKR